MPGAEDLSATPVGKAADLPLERYRSYLSLLAERGLRGELRVRLAASDIVQQTLLEAHRHRQDFRGDASGELAAWLRQILVRQLIDADKALRRAKRDARRERSLEDSVGAGARGLEAWAGDYSSPSQRARRHEQTMRLIDALSQLPEQQRRALTLRHCDGQSLLEIAEALSCSPAAAAGLLKRGLKKLRAILPDER